MANFKCIEKIKGKSLFEHNKSSNHSQTAKAVTNRGEFEPLELRLMRTGKLLVQSFVTYIRGLTKQHQALASSPVQTSLSCGLR